MKSVAVHNGTFHADDVLAVAILRLLYPKIKIIRTRNSEELKKVDFRVDVGEKYSPKTGDFDHHQNEFDKKRKNGISYASAGLIWRHFGMKLVNSKKAFDYIDEKIIQTVDAEDNGFEIFSSKKAKPYTFGKVIDSFNPCWQEKEADKDRFMEEAVLFTTKFMEREIASANGIVKAEKIVKEAISKSNGKYLILESFVPWKKTVINNSNIKFVITKSASNDEFLVHGVPPIEGSFENRIDFPKNWAGLREEELVRATGVKDAIFCHKHLFIAVAKSKEGAIKLAELALEEK